MKTEAEYNSLLNRINKYQKQVGRLNDSLREETHNTNQLKSCLSKYKDNVNYYRSELAGSWFDIEKEADELIN